MADTTPLISLINLTLHRNGSTRLTDITFQLRPHECWAVVGATGSGKTLLLQTLAGQFPVHPDTLTRRTRPEFVAFKEESHQFSYSGLFYQQRYQATMTEDRNGDKMPTLRDYLRYGDSPENEALIQRLGLDTLLPMPFLTLSNGQTRKARIGKALLRHPDVLLLDNPFVGLDHGFRAQLTDWLSELVRHGMTLMLVTDQNNIPDFVTHIVELDQGRIQWTGPKEAYTFQPPVGAHPNVPVLQTPPKPVDFSEAFILSDVTVRYGDTVVLADINWTVRAGERWCLLGPNGAGKSVLLSLLYGDHPQAYANQINVFGYRRGKAGESIWDVKRRIGFVSPELHLYFPQHLSVRQVILTGLTDTLTVPNRVSSDADADLTQLLSYFGLAETIDRPFGTLSTGEQRLVLLIRAILKNPPVLLLDEPFQALDVRSVELARILIDSLPSKTILFITHDQGELPDSVNRLYQLKPNRATSLPHD
ncbi:ATP-binding cassette domain-containing protein [Spirosoma knui]